MGIYSNPAENVGNARGSSHPGTNTQNVTDAMMLHQLQLIGEAMAKVETSVMNMILKKADYQHQSAKALVNQSGVFLDQANAQVKKIVAELAKQAKESFWEHLFGYVITALSVLIGSPELAVVTLALFAATESGGLKDLAGVISKSLQKDGVSKDVANILSDAVVVVVCVVVAGGASAGLQRLSKSAATKAATAAAADAVAKAAESSTETTVDAAINSSGAATNSTEEVAAQGLLSRVGAKMSKLASLLSKLNPAKNLTMPQAMALLAGSSAAMDTGLANDIAEEAVSRISNQKDKKALKMLIEIVLNLVVVVATMGSMGRAAGLGSKASGMSKMLDALKNSSLLSPTNANTLFQFWQATQTVTQLAEGVTQGVMADTQFTLASAIKEQGKDLAMSSFYNEIIEVLDAQASTTTQTLNGLENQAAKEIVSAAKGLSEVNLMAARELSA